MRFLKYFPPSARVFNVLHKEPYSITLRRRRRMDSIDGKIKSINDQLKGMATKFAELCWSISKNDLLYERKLNQVCNTNRMLMNRLDEIENQEKIKNIILYGKTEEEGEDITSYVGLVAMAVGTNCQPQDIEQVYRLGTKMRNEKRPRPIMVKMKETQKPNQIYYARSKLKGNPTFERIWINDDVTQNTRRMREDIRSVSLLCKEQGIDHKLHSDGIIVDGEIK